MKHILLIVTLLLAVGCETKAQQEYRTMTTQLRIQSWEACIKTGGSPIESSWMGAPAMERCEYKEVGNE